MKGMRKTRIVNVPPEIRNKHTPNTIPDCGLYTNTVSELSFETEVVYALGSEPMQLFRKFPIFWD
jgi:hypothetical protein